MCGRTACTHRCGGERKPDQSGQDVPRGPGASRRPYNTAASGCSSSAHSEAAGRFAKGASGRQSRSGPGRSQAWQRHSDAGAAARAEAVVPRPARARSDGGGCDSAPEFAGRRLPASVITSCVGIERTEGRRDLGHQAPACPGVPVITSLPANALLRFVQPGRVFRHAQRCCSVCNHGSRAGECDEDFRFRRKRHGRSRVVRVARCSRLATAVLFGVLSQDQTTSTPGLERRARREGVFCR